MSAPRLRIEPARPDWLEALVEGDSVFESRFGLGVSPGWSGFPEALPYLLDAARRSPLDPWGSHLVFDETDTPATLLGVGGWKGPPSAHGEAELGYAVAPGYQGRGVATAFVGALIASGRAAGVVFAVAHTLPFESASTGVLRRCGFRRVATVSSSGAADTESGSVWRWERWLTERLTIEPLAVEHAPDLFAALDDARVGTFIGGADVTTLDALLARIERLLAGAPADSGESWLNWAVRRDEVAGPDRPVIGRIEATVHRARPGGPVGAEVAYVFGPGWWGHGYATEAARWLIDHLRHEHDVAEVWATVDPRNEASIRLLRRLGFETATLPDGGLGSFDDGDLVFVRRRNTS